MRKINNYLPKIYINRLTKLIKPRVTPRQISLIIDQKSKLATTITYKILIEFLKKGTLRLTQYSNTSFPRDEDCSIYMM